MNEAQTYIRSLVTPNGRKPAGRKAWSIDLETVWLPFFTATNTVGDTHIAVDALGCPLRLSYAPDGSVRFSKAGKPILKVAKDLAESIRVVRENFSAGLLGYTELVISEHKQGYKAQVEMARKAGEPIISKDRANLDRAIAEKMEAELAKAEADALVEAQTGDKAKVPVTA